MSHPVQYLRQLQTWKGTALQRASKGIDCPPPEPCNCHCDCGGTTFEKPPPPLLPCPTYYPPYPTKPPDNAPPTTPYPVEGEPVAVVTTTTTLAPVVATTTSTTTKEFMTSCALGEVLRSDGTCTAITADTIREMKELVVEKKANVDRLEAEYAAKPGILTLKSRDLMDRSGALLTAHDEYRRALDLMLAIMGLYVPPAGANATVVEDPLGPEFVPGEYFGGAHCEPWTTTNKTAPAGYTGAVDTQGVAVCAAICRHQPFCKSFALDNSTGQCVWFDYNDPAPKDMGPQACWADPCSMYVKVRNVTSDPLMIGSIEKVHITTELLNSVLAEAEANSQITNETLLVWEHETDADLKAVLKEGFLGAKNNYTQMIGNAALVRTERQASVKDALDRLRAEALTIDGESTIPLPSTSNDTTCFPVFPNVTIVTTTPVPVVATTTTTTTTQPLVMVNWADMPNSQDSDWAARHPQCPMGPPCFCDCKCRGSPPQNFIEPPPPPPEPCPGPGPLPDPSRFSLPMGAPAMPPNTMSAAARGIR